MKISIIIPVKDLDTDVLYRINSTVQSCIINCDYEVILISDVKFDPKKDIPFYEEFNDKWNFIINKKPIGVFESRRLGVEAATGDLIWFVDSTDSMGRFEPYDNILDFDITFHDISYKVQESNSYTQIFPQHDGDLSITEYVKLNPFTNKIITKNFMSPYIGICIFKTDFIKTVYSKLPKLKNFNRYSGFYLLTAALLSVKALKYKMREILYVHTFKEEYDDFDGTKSTNKELNFYALNPYEVFKDEYVDELKKILKSDTETDTPQFIYDFIDSLKNDRFSSEGVTNEEN